MLLLSESCGTDIEIVPETPLMQICFLLSKKKKYSKEKKYPVQKRKVVDDTVMMLFVGDTVIPISRLIKITFVAKEVSIDYDGGELLEVDGSMYPRIDTIKMNCENEDEANKIKRQFYKACAANQNVFYFG